MFGKKEEPVITTKYVYQGNMTRPRPVATEGELVESAEQFADIMDSIFDLLDRANKLMDKPVVDEVERSSYYGIWPRFPYCGQQVKEELHKAQSSVIEANKLVAVQGYAAQRRVRKTEE